VVQAKEGGSRVLSEDEQIAMALAASMEPGTSGVRTHAVCVCVCVCVRVHVRVRFRMRVCLSSVFLLFDMHLKLVCSSNLREARTSRCKSAAMLRCRIVMFMTHRMTSRVS